MPLLAIRDESLSDRAALTARLAACLAALPPGAPVVVMIHGFRYNPSDPSRDPHRHILALAPDRGWGAVSWPRRLGLGGDAGLAVAWGWKATGTIWRAHRRAEASARALAEFVALCRDLDPGRPLHVLAHSLGARVALLALDRLEPGAVQRMILIAPAASAAEARAAASSPAGRTAEVICATGRENLVFDILMWLALPHHGRRVGPGAVREPGWLDLSLDRAPALSALAGLGWRVAPARAAVCHWSGYLRPGVWRLYRDLLMSPKATWLVRLRTALAEGPPQSPWRRAKSAARSHRMVSREIASAVARVARS